MTRLSVCHLGKFYPPAEGGIETHVATLARQQARLGLQVSVLCINHRADGGRDATFEPWARTRDIEERDTEVSIRRLGRVASIARFDVAPAALAAVAAQRADVVHLHSPNPTMLMALAVARPPGTLVITHHSDVVRQRVLGQLFRPFERLVYRRAAAVLTTSALYAAGSSLLQTLPVEPRALPLGIDLKPFQRPSQRAQAFAQTLRDEHGQPLWVSIGRLVYYKGLDVAAQALRELPGRWLIAGAGPLEADLRRKIASLGLSERVRFLGKLADEDVPGLYRAATALWFPSRARSEGFGIVQIEAMASGCPVINTSIPDSGVSWVSPHEVTGLTVPMDDAPAFAAASRRLLDDPDLRERLAMAGPVRAAAEFDSEAMAQRSIALYEEALRASTAARAVAV